MAFVNYKNIPNLLTLLRIILVFPCAYNLYYDNHAIAIALFVLASGTDCIDGLLARKLSCQTQLGAVLDPLADKLLIVVLFSVLTLKGFLPSWFAAIVIIREFILLSGAAFYRFMFGPVIFVPTLMSKFNTCLLLFLLLLSLLQSMSIVVSTSFINYLLIMILATSIYSALDYIHKWTKRVYKTLQAS